MKLLRAITILMLALTGCGSDSSFDLGDSPLNTAIPRASVLTRDSDEALKPAEPPPPVRYRIRSGDVLRISVLREPEMEQSIPVGPDGRISYYVAADILAAGKTFEELREELRERLRDYFIDPQVVVTGEAYQGNTVSVLGQVARPGEYVVRSDTRLLDAIASSGGLKQTSSWEPGTPGVIDLADLQRAYVMRHDRFLPVDFAALFSEDEAAVAHNNIYLMAGDRIVIPSTASQENRVIVLGEVQNPRVVRFHRRMTLLESVAEAGGIRPSAWERRVFVVRGSLSKPLVMPVNLRHVAVGAAPDVELQSGDIVFVPKTALGKTEDVARQLLPILDTIDSRRTFQ